MVNPDVARSLDLFVTNMTMEIFGRRVRNNKKLFIRGRFLKISYDELINNMLAVSFLKVNSLKLGINKK